MKCKCPYCGAEMERKIEFEVLSPRRRQLLDIVAAAGPNGIERDKVRRILFGENGNDTTIRTMAFGINEIIWRKYRKRIHSSGGIMRLSVE